MPWSVRQTGVYHQRSNGVEDLWILLNPRAESVIQTQLEKLEDSPKSIALTKIVEDPHRLHVLIFESCVRNWRWYLRHVGAIFEEKVGDLCPIYLMRELGAMETSKANSTSERPCVRLQPQRCQSRRLKL